MGFLPPVTGSWLGHSGQRQVSPSSLPALEDDSRCSARHLVGAGSALLPPESVNKRAYWLDGVHVALVRSRWSPPCQ